MVCVLATGQPGGAELSLATHLSHRPPWISPFAVLMCDGPLTAKLRDQGVPTQLQPLQNDLRAMARFTRSLARRIRGSDVVYAVGNKAILGSLPAAMTVGVPCVWYKVDLVMPAWQASVVAPLTKRVVSLSHAAGRPVRPGRLQVVYPPVRLDRRFAVTEQRPVAILTCFGRVEPTKGQHHLIAAAAVLRSRFPSVTVLLAGETPARSRAYGTELRSLANRLGVPLEMSGHVDVIEPVLARTTVYVQPSFRDRAGRGGEGLGIALAEASWAGLPVVATNTGGTPEVVKDGVTGTLVAPCDPRALAEAVGSYLGDAQLARRTGEAGARFARERFAPERVAGQLFDVIANVAQR